MAYRVRLTAPAEEDAYQAFEHLREAAPAYADRWLDGLFRAVFSLGDMPHRCPLIPEAGQIGRDIRHLHYGRRLAIYRILFDIEEQSDEGPRVRVLRIWHGSRDRVQVDDLEEEE